MTALGHIQALRQDAVYLDLAHGIADALLAQEKNGDNNAETDGGASEGRLTRQMRDASHDQH
jgi:hypothetical protein